MSINLRLDSQEKKIEKALGNGLYASVPDLAGSKKLFEEAAKNYRELGKTKRITIRVKTEDLIKVKARAKKSNIPYQTLINALIRQFAERQASLQV